MTKYAELCIKFYNLTYAHIGGCIELEAYLLKLEASYKLGCFYYGKDKMPLKSDFYIQKVQYKEESHVRTFFQHFIRTIKLILEKYNRHNNKK